MRCQSTRWVEASGKYLEVPCGKCLSCLTNKRNDWAFRLEQEYKSSKGAAFITLTYHPKFCPDYGLDKRHVQLYMKRLRKRYGKKLRYFCVGEYGTRYQRPHYHIILFTYEDVRMDSIINKAWSTRAGESFGIVDIRPVNYARIMYCTKYVIQRGNPTYQYKSKPFMLCSRSYGLGLNYLTDAMALWHRKGKRNFTLVFGERRRLPRYYKEKIWWPARKPVQRKTGGWCEHPDRKVVSEESKKMAEDARVKNLKIIREEGYSDPEAIQAEMWRAVLSRVKDKVAYTQTF